MTEESEWSFYQPEEPKNKKLYFSYKCGDWWTVCATYYETKPSPFKNDVEEFYCTTWLLEIKREGKLLPLGIMLTTDFNFEPTVRGIAKAIQEYFSNLVIGFAIDAFEVDMEVHAKEKGSYLSMLL